MRANTDRWLRRIFAPLSHTPFHPQWLVLRLEQRKLAELEALMTGTVVDIGCAEQKPKNHAPRGCRYIGLDYYQTATGWYGCRPDVFGDAQRLPLMSSSADCVLLLDVLEHLPDPDRCIAEAHRVLVSDGRLVLQVPFLYPIHDAPLDFHRWTRHGLARLGERHGFEVQSFDTLGSPAENVALLLNLALAGALMRWIERKSPLALFGIFAPVLVPFFNLAGALLAGRGNAEAFMSLGYRVVFTKK